MNSETQLLHIPDLMSITTIRWSPTCELCLVAQISSGTAAAADANGGLNIAIDENSKVFYVGGSTILQRNLCRRSQYYDRRPGYNITIRTLSTNADGTIAFQTGSSASDNRVGFTAFQRTTHTGTTKNELIQLPDTIISFCPIDFAKSLETQNRFFHLAPALL